MTPVHYTVAAGDTLSGIAARFAVRGGWPALYAANRRLIGRDPDAIRPGMVLTLAPPVPPAGVGPGRAWPAPPGTAASRIGRHRARARAGRHRRAGHCRHAAVAENHAAGRGPARRGGLPRRARTGGGAPPPAAAAGRAPRPGPAEAGQQSAPRRLCPNRTRIILADYDRLVVTRNERDGMVYVLRPPGQDPKAILQVARLVLPEEPYGELAAQLGVAAGWRME